MTPNSLTTRKNEGEFPIKHKLLAFIIALLIVLLISGSLLSTSKNPPPRTKQGVEYVGNLADFPMEEILRFRQFYASTQLVHSGREFPNLAFIG